MSLSLRPATIRDAPACGLICYEAFRAIAEQHGFPTDFPDPERAIETLSGQFVASDVYSVVAEIDGRVVGSICLRELSPIARLGPITVAPDAQDSSVGRQLMDHVLRRAQVQGFPGVHLVQDAYHSRSLALYTKLGFDTREPLSVVQGPAFGVEIPGYAVRPMTEADVALCNRLCVRVHGHDRGQELLDAVRLGTATVVEQGGQITGYATSIGFYGHAIGESNESLKALLGSAWAFEGPGVLLPTRNGELLRWCLEQGLRVIKPMTLMTLGLYSEPVGASLPSIHG